MFVQANDVKMIQLLMLLRGSFRQILSPLVPSYSDTEGQDGRIRGRESELIHKILDISIARLR
jgi:hypothetical protein